MRTAAILPNVFIGFAPSTPFNYIKLRMKHRSGRNSTDVTSRNLPLDFPQGTEDNSPRDFSNNETIDQLPQNGDAMH
jgi:hypothetical protein